MTDAPARAAGEQRHAVEQSGSVFLVLLGPNVVASHDDPSAAIADATRRDAILANPALTGWDGTDPEALFAAAEAAGSDGTVSMQPVQTDEAIALTPDDPVIAIEPRTGLEFRFLPMSQVPSVKLLLVLEIAQALNPGTSAVEAILAGVRFLRTFMAPGELERFEAATAATHIGMTGAVEVLRWLNEDVAPHYTAHPTQPDPS